MKLMNLREIEEKYGVNPLASYNLHKTFPDFEHFVMHPTTLGYKNYKINQMMAEPKYAVGAGGIHADGCFSSQGENIRSPDNMVGASFLGDLWQGFKTGVKEVADVAAPFVPLLVGLGREESHKKVNKKAPKPKKIVGGAKHNAILALEDVFGDVSPLEQPHRKEGGMHDESDSEEEEEEHEKTHVAHELGNCIALQGLKEHELEENNKLKKVKKLANEMLVSNRRMLRAELVRKIMKERGVKMIEASRIIKKEGLKY